jgi:hypothetical protein
MPERKTVDVPDVGKLEETFEPELPGACRVIELKWSRETYASPASSCEEQTPRRGFKTVMAALFAVVTWLATGMVWMWVWLPPQAALL